MNTYSVEVLDQADADIDGNYLRLLRKSLEDAMRWQAGLETALDSLSSMPNRCPKARDGGRYPDVAVRQLFYGKHRLIFHVVEAAADEEEGIVHVLRVLHGGQSMEQANEAEA